LKQAKLLELKNNHPLMKRWSNYNYSTIIWRAIPHNDNGETRTYSNEQSVWLVRAGSRGERENIALEKNVVGIGYGGGLKTIDTTMDYETFKQQYMALHPNEKREFYFIINLV
jgi:hypothetical protein